MLSRPLSVEGLAGRRAGGVAVVEAALSVLCARVLRGVTDSTQTEQTYFFCFALEAVVHVSREKKKTRSNCSCSTRCMCSASPVCQLP